MEIPYPQLPDIRPQFRAGWSPPRWLALARDQSAPGNLARPDRSQAVSTDLIARFEAFYLQYDRQIAGFLWRMLDDEQIAAELNQETFLCAWQHFPEISAYNRPVAWLFRVATNLALQHLRRRNSVVGAAEPFTAEQEPASSDPSLRFVERDLVRQTLQQLPPNQRAALVLRAVDGLSCAEIGEILNISRDAVKMALWRAREQFRARYLREEAGQ